MLGAPALASTCPIRDMSLSQTAARGHLSPPSKRCCGAAKASTAPPRATGQAAADSSLLTGGPKTTHRAAAPAEQAGAAAPKPNALLHSPQTFNPSHSDLSHTQPCHPIPFTPQPIATLQTALWPASQCTRWQIALLSVATRHMQWH